MTTFTAFQPVNLNPALIGAAVSALTGHPSLLVHSGTEFEVATTTAELDIHGSGFTYPFGPSYGPGTGTITTLELSFKMGSSYVPAYEFTGLAIPAHQLQLDVIQGNFSAIFALFVHGHERINGSPFADHLNDYGGFDSITGGAGNDIMNGAHGYDKFYFHVGFGHDVIKHFIAGIVVNHDTIVLHHDTGWLNFAQVHAGETLVGGDVQIMDTSGDTITFANIHTLTALKAADFHFIA